MNGGWNRHAAWAAAAVTWCFVTAMPEAVAQAIPQADLDVITRSQDQIQQRQEDQQRLLDLQSRRQRGDETPPAALPALPDGEDGGTACVDVHDIQLRGADSLSNTEKADTVYPYLHRCLTLRDLNALLKALSQQYVDRGLVAARPYLPAQDLANGHLEIVVVEGEVEAVVPATAPESGPESRMQEGSGSTALALAFPGVIGAPLNLRDFEQGLDQINRLRSNHAKMTLEPGSAQGKTKVVIHNQPEKRWRISLGGNNSGQASTGRYKLQGSGEIDNLLGLNDMLSVSLDRTTAYDTSWRGARGVTGFVSVPYGYWTAALSGNYYQYTSPVLGLSQPYQNSGSTKSWRLSLDRVLHRDADGKTAASLQARTYSASSYINQTRLLASSYDLTVLQAGLSHSRKLLGGMVSASGTWEQGMDLWRAKADSKSAAKTAPDSQFRKATADLSYLRPLDLAPVGLEGTTLYVSTALHGQWSPDTLYGSERLSLGGESAVRGFNADYPSGDTGGTWRTELSLPFTPVSGGPVGDLLGQISPFIAYDIGALRGDPKDDRERGVTSGAAIGLRGSGRLTWSATYAAPVRAPSFVRERDHELYFSASLKF